MNKPQVKIGKNGYEIRSDILEIAHQYVMDEYKFKMMGWEMSATKGDDGSVTTKVEMPSFPGKEQVLETARIFYGFVDEKR